MDFLESIKVEKDREKEMLLNVQARLEKEGITSENVLRLTRNLTENQKQRLKQLYKEQIDDLDSSIENYRRKIIRLRSSLNKK